MEKLILRTQFISIILFLFGILGCAPGEEGFFSGIDSNIPVSNTFIERTDSILRTTGSIRFNQPYASGNGTSIALKGSLDSNFSVIRVYFFTDFSLSSGLIVEFARNGALVEGRIRVNGSTSIVTTSTLWANPASLDLVIDAHRVGTQHRILIWQRDSVGYTPTTARIDTQRSGDISPTLPNSISSGTQTGLEIYQSTVTDANVSFARSAP